MELDIISEVVFGFPNIMDAHFLRDLLQAFCGGSGTLHCDYMDVELIIQILGKLKNVGADASPIWHELW